MSIFRRFSIFIFNHPGSCLLFQKPEDGSISHRVQRLAKYRFLKVVPFSTFCNCLCVLLAWNLAQNYNATFITNKDSLSFSTSVFSVQIMNSLIHFLDALIRVLKIYTYSYGLLMQKQSDLLLNADDLDAMWVCLRENCVIDDATGAEKVSPP